MATYHMYVRLARGQTRIRQVGAVSTDAMDQNLDIRDSAFSKYQGPEKSLFNRIKFSNH